MWWQLSVVCFGVLFGSATSEESSEPYLNILMKSMVCYVGERKAIFCEGKNLAESLQWVSPQGNVIPERSPKNTRVFVERPRGNSPTLVPLMVQNFEIEDSGNWTCKSGDLKESVYLLVGERASVKPFNKVEADEGTNARLECRTSGHPSPVVQWYRDAVIINALPRKYVLDNNNQRLTIRKVDHLDAGSYTCKVTQEAISHYREGRVDLEVKHQPVMQLSSSQEVYALPNETKKIECGAIANPAPKYEWARRINNYDSRIEPDDRIETAEDGSSSTLILHLHDQSDLGEYVCTAANTRGTKSVVFHLSFGNKPNPPDMVTFISASTNEMVFNVTCSSCYMKSSEEMAPNPENLTTLGYSFEFVPANVSYLPDWDQAEEFHVDIEDPNNTTFTVGELVNSTVYHIRVRTRNAAGYSEWFFLPETQATTKFAISLVASTTLVILAAIFTRIY